MSDERKKTHAACGPSHRTRYTYGTVTDKISTFVLSRPPLRLAGSWLRIGVP